jgi:hypothetical protein
LKIGRRLLQPLKSFQQPTIEINSLSFLMDTSNYKEQPNKQEDVAGRNKGKEEEAESRKQELENQAQTVFTLGLDQIITFLYRLDGPLGEGNV